MAFHNFFPIIFFLLTILTPKILATKFLPDEDDGLKTRTLEIIHDVTTNNIGNLCQQQNFKSVRLNIETGKLPGFVEAESKLILAAHLIEDVEAAQHNEKIIQAVLKNILNSQRNLLQVRFLSLNPFLKTLTANLQNRKKNDASLNSTLQTDETSTPWFFRRLTDSKILDEKFMNYSLNSDGWWTFPYFSCGEMSWILSFAIPIRTKSEQTERLLQRTSELNAILVADVDMTELDINQCDLDGNDDNDIGEKSQLREFTGSHKCHRETSMCKFISGQGWVKGSYHCLCREGYYATSGNSFFNGSLVEVAWRDKQEQGSDAYDRLYQCQACSPGCNTCTDGAPCLATYNWTFRYILLAISLFCFLLTFILATLVYSFRKMRVFKVASPSFLCITLTGCAIMYLEMVAIFPYLDMYFCIMTKWTRHLGFLITYSALLMKTWRVNLTYRVKSAHKLKLTDKQLLQWMLPIILVMVTYLSAWTISDPPQGIFNEDGDGLKFKQCTYGWWDHSLGLGEFLFLLWGIKVCYNVRKARTQFDEAKLIRWSIYNIAVVNIIMVTFHLIIFPHAGPDTKYFLGFLRTQMGTSVTIVLVFGPKFFRMIRGTANEFDDRQRINNVAMLDGPIDREEDMENTDREENKDLEQENDELKEEIQKLASQIEHMKIVGMLTDNRHIRAKKDGYFTKENLLKQLDHFQPHFTTSPNSQQNGGSTTPNNKMDQFRRAHSVRAVQSSPCPTEESRQKWSTRTMPKSVAAALNSKNRKPNKSGNNKDSTSQDIQITDSDNLTLIVPERSRSVIRIHDPESEKSEIPSCDEHKLIQRCASENNAKVKDYSLADNINWFLSDSHGDEDKKGPLILRQQPSVEAQTQFPEIASGSAVESGPVMLHPCCAAAKKKSRKKKRLSFRKGGDDVLILAEKTTDLSEVLQSLDEVIRIAKSPEKDSPGKVLDSEETMPKQVPKGAEKVREKVKGHKDSSSKSCCKHFSESSRLKKAIRPENVENEKSQIYLGATERHEDEESLIGSNFIPDHVKSLIPERV